jgi:hypothetical protein
MSRKAYPLLALALFGGWVIPSRALGADAGTGYHYRQLTVKRAGINCPVLDANSENNRGVILGTVYCGDARGFIEKHGHVHQFAVPGPAGTDTLPAGIADNGTIALDTEVNYKGSIKAYVRGRSGHLRKLKDPHAGRYGTDVESVNSKGEAVGYYYVGKSQSRIRPFIERHRKFHGFRLGVKHAKDVALVDVNRTGDLVGFYERHGVYHGFVDRHGHMHIVNAPGAGRAKGEGTQVLDISDNGRSWCGMAIFATGTEYQDTSQGFVAHRGHVTSLRVPSSWGHTSYAAAVNNAGVVVGDFIASNNVGWAREGFRATP